MMHTALMKKPKFKKLTHEKPKVKKLTHEKPKFKKLTHEKPKFKKHTCEFITGFVPRSTPEDPQFSDIEKLL